MLENIFDSRQVKSSKEDLKKWGGDWTNVKPNPSVIVFPETENQIIELVKYAIKDNKKIVPSGGRTGLSGGATAVNNEIVLSLDKMNNILEFNSSDRLVKCQSGIITKELQDFALSKGLFYPVDFSSSGSSQIGGNIATNAGGIRVIRYGLTRNWVKGIKVINGIGELMSFNEGLVKNASGYDLRNLIIGSEGTLGIITEVDISLTKKPPPQRVILLGLNDPKDLIKTLAIFSRDIEISAFEFFSKLCMEKVSISNEVVEPFSKVYEYYALIEFDDSDVQKIEKAFEISMEEKLVEDGIISNSDKQFNQIWKLRENISESISSYRPYKNDISLKISLIPLFLEEIVNLIKIVGSEIEVCLFGHIGDGNIHVNLLRPENYSEEKFHLEATKITNQIYKKISRLNGSISAEHGIGLIKKEYLGFSRSKEEIALMKGIKNLFDPYNILNPGKIFD